MNKFWKRKSEELRILDKRKKLRKKIQARKRAGRPTMALESKYQELSIRWWQVHDTTWLDGTLGYDLTISVLTQDDIRDYMKDHHEPPSPHSISAEWDWHHNQDGVLEPYYAGDRHVDVTFWDSGMVKDDGTSLAPIILLDGEIKQENYRWLSPEQREELERRWREHLATGE